VRRVRAQVVLKLGVQPGNVRAGQQRVHRADAIANASYVVRSGGRRLAAILRYTDLDAVPAVLAEERRVWRSAAEA
jgi:hypothetical protein